MRTLVTLALLAALWSADALAQSGSAPNTPIIPPISTYSGHITLPAATSVALTAANVTTYGAMDAGNLPAPGAFGRLVVAPAYSTTTQYCKLTNACTATGGVTLGSGTNLGSDTENLTGIGVAPSFYSVAGGLVYFSN